MTFIGDQKYFVKIYSHLKRIIFRLLIRQISAYFGIRYHAKQFFTLGENNEFPEFLQLL